MWKYINKFRKKKEGVEESIELNKWYEHFMGLLEGTETRVMLEEEEMRKKGKIKKRMKKRILRRKS